MVMHGQHLAHLSGCVGSGKAAMEAGPRFLVSDGGTCSSPEVSGGMRRSPGHGLQSTWWTHPWAPEQTEELWAGVRRLRVSSCGTARDKAGIRSP